MFTILVVDDEPRQVKALVAVIRQLKPAYTVMEAYDGDEALDIIRRDKVDILISDINMPHLSGIALIEILSKLTPTPKIVMLTGYDEFEYAVQALRFQAFDYLLKPIGKPELTVLLERLEALLLEEQHSSQKLLTDQRQLAATAPVYEYYLMNQWIHLRADSGELSEVRARLHNASARGAIILFALHNKLALSESETIEASCALRESILQQFDPSDQLCVFRLEEDSRLLVLPYFCESAEGINKLLPIFDRLSSMNSPESGLNIAIAAGPVVQDLLVDAAYSFKQAHSALSALFYGGQRKVIMADDSPLHFSSRFPFKEEFSLFMNALNEQDDYALQKLVGGHLDKLKDHKCDPVLLKDEWYGFMLQAVKPVRNQLEDEDCRTWMAELKLQLYNCREYTEIRPILLTFLLKVHRLFHRHSKTQQQVVITQCIQYITQNYNKDISLEEVSGRYHFHPSYFSTLFKSIAEIGFSEYVQKVRIDEAKKLILSTDKKMNEIALCVGYRDAAYFNKTFKKETGVSPNKYKRIQKLE
ncbi:Regulator of RpoS [Paenibacillus auburnensis]|jgi:two-component system, response regulator YesN|uniref:Regulator of RpoS n=1 Tax=Paenibacillus auburnensis TaxID=2905649 RepID=A0ABM9BWR2_9BACL|nr:response regulator [Paenibacillus auburnensis]CAH1195139.1 Regulator of RpoS [Paenibacillus auburnensis]